MRQGARRNTKYSRTPPRLLAGTRDGSVGVVDEETERVEVKLRGVRGPSQYDYTIQLSVDEVGALIRDLVARADGRRAPPQPNDRGVRGRTQASVVRSHYRRRKCLAIGTTFGSLASRRASSSRAS